MPYSGVPANLTAKVDKCVKDVLADDDFKAKGDRTRKQSAIAICISRIAPKDDWVAVETEYVPVKADTKFIIRKPSGPTVGEAVSARAFYTVPHPVRSVENVDGRYRAYGVLFGDSGHRDLYKQYFTKDTDFHLDWYKSWPWLYSHGHHAVVGAQKVGSWDTFGMDDVGVFIEGELDESCKYNAAIETLIAEEVLFPSSRAVADLVRYTDDGMIVEWPIVEVSTTVKPAEYRMTPVSAVAARAIRSLGGVTMTDEERKTAELAAEAAKADDVEAPEPGDDTAVAGGTAPDADDAAQADGTDGDEDDEGVAAYTLEEVTEAVTKSFNMDKVVDAISLLDATMKSLSDRVGVVEALAEQLDKSEAAKVKSVLQTGSWFDKLYVASKDAQPLEDGDKDGVAKDSSERPLEDGESIWERVSGQSES